MVLDLKKEGDKGERKIAEKREKEREKIGRGKGEKDKYSEK